MNEPILIIEDNEQNMYLMRFLLQKHGFAVVEAHDGPAGIELARCAPPRAILLDIQLPLLDGYAVAEELRRIPALDRVPIIAVTSYAMVGDRERILTAGADGYIEKPINPDTFVDQIRRHIEGGTDASKVR